MQAHQLMAACGRAKYLVLSCVILLSGCSPATQQAAEPPDTRAADEAAIRKADADWAKAAQTRQVDAWLAFYSGDVVVLPPNDKTATTKEAVRKVLNDLLTLPALNISWQLTKVEVARSGDIAYGYGTYDLTFNDPKGKAVQDKGKILEIWKKQPDGAWKCIVDTWNTDSPLTQ